MNDKKMLQLLGLATKSRKCISGESLCLTAIKNQSAKLVILASDAGPNTTKRILDKSSFYHVPVIHDLTSEEISRSIGKNNRMVVAIQDSNFAKMLEDAHIE